MQLELRWIGKPARGEGRFSYVAPDQATLNLAKLAKHGPVQFQLQGTTLNVEPPAARQKFNLSGENFAEILNFFAGRIAGNFYEPPAKIDRKENIFHYVQGKQELWLDGKRGVITRLRSPAATGGINEFDITEYTFVDGVWLPLQMRLHNTNSGWTARLTFSNWMMNTTVQGPMSNVQGQQTTQTSDLGPGTLDRH
jgi:hypothetical protein